MSKPRPTPFRALAVHRPAAGDHPAPVPAPVPARLRSGFAELLRRAPPAAPEGRGARGRSVTGLVAPTYLGERFASPVGAEHDDGDASHDERADDGDPGDPARDDGAWTPAATGAAGAWAVLSPGALASLLAQAVPATGEHLATPPTVRALVATIAGFCNERAVSDSEGWHVRIALRPEVMAETTLDLSVSSDRLQLRFQAVRPDARRLLCEHANALREQLAQALDRQREIAIDID